MIHVSSEHGIQADLGGIRIGLDDYRGTGVDYLFVSHAHGDHLRKMLKPLPALCSEETALLAAAKGVELRLSSLPGVELFPTGHILGSMALRVEKSLVYTGDMCDRSRGPIRGFDPPRADTLIIESTYGSSEFLFPKLDDVLDVAKDCIEDCFRRDVPVVAMGYALGKAQHLELLLDKFGPSYVHPSLTRYDEIYRIFGMKIRQKIAISNARERWLLEKKPWILFAPCRSGRSFFNRYMVERFGARLMAFSGWACEKGYKSAMAVDEAFPLSDHSDFEGLLRTVKRSGATRVLTTHGFCGELAQHLRKMGYDAQPLRGDQRTLRRYITDD